MRLLNIVNEIIKLAEAGDFWGQEDISIQSFGIGNNAINFTGENRTKYNDLIFKALRNDPEIERTYTLKKYETLFIDHFRELLLKNCPAQKENATSFSKSLKIKKLQTFKVFRGISGIKLNEPSKILNLGKFKIYNIESQKKFIESLTNANPDFIWKGELPEYLIECTAQSRHFEKAIEIADGQFEHFEQILRFIIGLPTTQIEAGVINYQGLQHRTAYVFSDNGQVSKSSKKVGAWDKIPLDAAFFTEKNPWIKTAWNLLGEKSLNKMEERILLAVEWIGQSLCESSPQSAFLKAAIALGLSLHLMIRRSLIPLSFIESRKVLLSYWDIPARIGWKLRTR